MIEFLFYYTAIGFILVLQHSYRFYKTNKEVLGYSKYSKSLKGSKMFYFAAVFLWIFVLDFLIEVNDYNDR